MPWVDGRLASMATTAGGNRTLAMGTNAVALTTTPTDQIDKRMSEIIENCLCQL